MINHQLKYTPPQPKGVDKLSIHTENSFEYTPLEGWGANFLIHDV